MSDDEKDEKKEGWRAGQALLSLTWPLREGEEGEVWFFFLPCPCCLPMLCCMHFWHAFCLAYLLPHMHAAHALRDSPAPDV